jgi:hypothetical protein
LTFTACSFGRPVTELSALGEAVSEFASRATVKLESKSVWSRWLWCSSVPAHSDKTGNTG